MSRDPLKNLRVATPCETSWESMAGDERVRHCSLCSLNVYNFAEMSRDEIRALLVRTEGRICGRLYRRADGTLMTSDCPSGLQVLRQRMSRLATAVIAAMFSVAAFASDATCVKPRTRKHGSKIKLEIEQAATPQQAVLTGVVHWVDNPLPGVTVTLRDEVTKHEMTAVTDMNGAFTIPALHEGLYRVDVTFEGFKPAGVEHLLLKQNEITHARVELKMDPEAAVTVGIIAVPDWQQPTISTTYPQELINKLPL